MGKKKKNHALGAARKSGIAVAGDDTQKFPVAFFFSLAHLTVRAQAARRNSVGGVTHAHTSTSPYAENPPRDVKRYPRPQPRATMGDGYVYGWHRRGVPIPHTVLISFVLFVFGKGAIFPLVALSDARSLPVRVCRCGCGCGLGLSPRSLNAHCPSSLLPTRHSRASCVFLPATPPSYSFL